MWQLRKKNWLLPSKKKSKNEIHLLRWCWGRKTTSLIALSLACWSMLARRLCVYNAGLKVDVGQEILTVVMASYYENVYSCKRHTVVHRAVCFLVICFALSWPRNSLPWVLIKFFGLYINYAFWVLASRHS